MLETGQHEVSSFVTLTYDPEHHPADGSVSVSEAQMFLKRVRRRVGSLRYFIVGEYGERTWRPHYHAALFGVRDVGVVRAAWQKGHVHCSGMGVESARYLAGYVCKGLYSERGMRWQGKELRPEFARMSLRPGLGARSADAIGAFYRSREGSKVLASVGDVSAVVRQGLKLWPLGRYLRQRVKDSVGIDAESQSRLRQLSEGAALLDLDQEGLNARLELAQWKSGESLLKATAKYKRQSLERKL